MPELSVVVPAYQSVDTIETCLGSLLGQSLQPDAYEVVVVLNGPDDGTPAAVRRLAASDEHSRVVVVDSDATSAGAARNAGVAVARGAYTTFVDSDDWVSADFLELLLESAHPARVAVSRLDDVSLDGSVSTATAVNQAIEGRREDLIRVQGALTLAALNACKAYPTQWLRETPYVEELRSGEDVVLAGHLYQPYSRQYVQFDLTPARRGATYFRRLVEDSVSRQELTRDFAVRQRLAVIDEVTRGTQRDPADRTQLVQSIVSAQFAFVRQYLAEHPDEHEAVSRLIADAGVPGVNLHTAVGARAAGGFELFHTRAGVPGGLTVAALDAQDLDAHARLLAYLGRRGIDLQLVHVNGTLSPTLARLPGAVRLPLVPATVPGLVGKGSSALPARLLRLGRRKGLVAAGHVAPRVAKGGLAARLALRAARTPGKHRTAESSLRRTRVNYSLDRSGVAILDAFGFAGVRTDGVDRELATLVMRIASGVPRAGRSEALAIRRASSVLRATAARGDSDDASMFPGLWAMAAQNLMRSDRFSAAGSLLDDATALFTDEERTAAGLDALVVLHPILSSAKDAPGLETVRSTAAATLRAADAALDENDVDRAVFLTALAVELYFLPRMHTTVQRSPLVDDPAAYLDDFSSSKVGHLLEHPAHAHEHPADSLPSDRRTVTVVHSTHRDRIGTVVDALATHARVRVLDLALSEPRFRDGRPDVTTVRERILAGLGQHPILDHTRREALSADVVLVEGADKGLAWVTQVAPHGARIVVRLHASDTLGPWVHMVDWTRVSDLLVTSQHVRRATEALLGDRLADVRLHIVHDAVETAGTDEPKLPGAEHTLGLVGWAERSKDPGWALELLALLRAQDPRWRLLLIGDDFHPKAIGVQAETARAFRRRALAHDLIDAVDYLGRTDRLSRHLRGVGWAVNSSLRESYPNTLMAMAATGAVPVVRDWPLYARVGGARELLPEEWVVETPEEAAARILAAAPDWAERSLETAQLVARDFSGEDAIEHMRSVVLG